MAEGYKLVMNEKHRFAVATREGGEFKPVVTYKTSEILEGRYKLWRACAGGSNPPIDVVPVRKNRDGSWVEVSDLAGIVWNGVEWVGRGWEWGDKPKNQ